VTRVLVRLAILAIAWLGTLGLALTGSTSAQALAPVVPTIVGSIGGPAELVKVEGSFAYVAAGPLLRVISLQDPARPREVGSFTFPEKVWALAVSGSVVYAADDWVGLAILDVTNPATPRLRGTYKTLGQAWGVAVRGDTAIVANQMSGIDVLDVSDLDKPVPLGQYFTEGYARDVAVAGPLAYVVDQPSGFSVLDLSTRGAPTEVSTMQAAQSPQIVVVSDAPSGQRLASLAGGRGAAAYIVQVYDVSDPRAPVMTSTMKTAGRSPRVAMLGSTAYIADVAEGLQIVDLSNPAQPVRVGAFTTAGPARDVAVTDSLIVVAVGESRPGAGPREGGGGVLVLRRAP